MTAHNVTTGRGNGLARLNRAFPRLRELRRPGGNKRLWLVRVNGTAFYQGLGIGDSPSGIVERDCLQELCVKRRKFRRPNIRGKFSGQRSMRWLSDQPATFVLARLRVL